MKMDFESMERESHSSIQLGEADPTVMLGRTNRHCAAADRYARTPHR